MQIVKDKNIISFSIEENKVYKIDLSTLTMYGIAGKPLKNLPKPLQDSRVQYDLRNDEKAVEKALLLAVIQLKENFTVNAETLGVISLYERFLVVGLRFESFVDVYRNYETFSKIKLDGAFIEFVKNNARGLVSPRTIREYGMRDFRAKYPMSDRQFEYLTDIVNYCDNDTDFMEYLAIGIIHKHIDMIQGWHGIAREFYRIGKEMEKDWKKEKFMFDAYCHYKFEYEIWKNKAIDERIAKRYNEKYLFENDDCLVIMPKSVNDFKNEGDNNSNCVAGYAHDHASGDTIIVFVRRKSNPEKSYITCQISPNTLHIRQYRTSHNNDADAVGNRFKEQYQAHLNTLR